MGRFQEQGRRWGFLCDFGQEKNQIFQVPLIGEMPLSEILGNGVSKEDKMRKILDFAKGPSLNIDSEREGLVFKSQELIDNQIVSFKVISNGYLLKE